MIVILVILAATTYDQGRTLTHEVGHWLNLRHMGRSNCGDDFCNDTPTPVQNGCPNYPHLIFQVMEEICL